MPLVTIEDDIDISPSNAHYRAKILVRRVRRSEMQSQRSHLHPLYHVVGKDSAGDARDFHILPAALMHQLDISILSLLLKERANGGSFRLEQW